MNTKSIVILLGSPRKEGNSSTLAKQVEMAAKASGANVETLHLHKMNMQFCTGCSECREKTSKNCNIDDDMQVLYPKLRQADAVVFASPIYWANISGQMKVFMDRCFALGGPEGDDLENKKFGVILTHAIPDQFKSGIMNAIRVFQDSFGPEIVDFICGNAMDSGQIKENKGIMDRAFNLGKRLAEA